MTVSTHAVQQAVHQTQVPSAPPPTVETPPANETLQNEPKSGVDVHVDTSSAGTPTEDITPSLPSNPLLSSFIRDLNPQNAIQLHIATRLAHIAHQQNRLAACESQILQNEATRLYENQLIRWRQACDDHAAKYGSYNDDHPLPEKPAQEPQSELSLLAHAFSPTLLPHNAPAAKRPPVLSPLERYFRHQQSLDAQFLRLHKTYRQLQNEPKSGVDVHVDTSSAGTPTEDITPSLPANPVLQNEPKSGVDVPVDTSSAGTPTEDYPILQNEPKVPSAPSPTVKTPPTLEILQNKPTPPEA